MTFTGTSLEIRTPFASAGSVTLTFFSTTPDVAVDGAPSTHSNVVPSGNASFGVPFSNVSLVLFFRTSEALATFVVPCT